MGIIFKSALDIRGLIENRIRRAQQEVDKLLPKLISGIVERTRSGRGLAPYSASYAKKKGSSTVNLTLSGSMLNSLKGKVTLQRFGFLAEIAVTGEFNRAKAGWHTSGTSRMPARPFMFLDNRQKFAIVKAITSGLLKR